MRAESISQAVICLPEMLETMLKDFCWLCFQQAGTILEPPTRGLLSWQQSCGHTYNDDSTTDLEHANETGSNTALS